MSDSSEEEDLSKFREAVDTSFTKLLNNPTEKESIKEKPKSERYIEESTHYNDVKVPKQMQKQIGAKLSAVISKKIQFIEVDNQPLDHDQEVDGGIKLFKDSKEFLTCEGTKDTYTEQHNRESKRIKKKRRLVEEESHINEHDKLKAVAVSPDYILSKEEIKLWKSRRKEKLFKYKTNGNSKVLTAVEK